MREGKDGNKREREVDGCVPLVVVREESGVVAEDDEGGGRRGRL